MASLSKKLKDRIDIHISLDEVDLQFKSSSLLKRGKFEASGYGNEVMEILVLNKTLQKIEIYKSLYYTGGDGMSKLAWGQGKALRAVRKMKIF